MATNAAHRTAHPRRACPAVQRWFALLRIQPPSVSVKRYWHAGDSRTDTDELTGDATTRGDAEARSSPVADPLGADSREARVRSPWLARELP